MLKIGMLTSGGDCQGLNAALRGVAKTLYNELGDKVTIDGIRDGYRGLIEGDYHEMLPEDFSDILTVGGTILGTSCQPFKEMRKTIEDSEETKLDKMLHTVKKAGFDCLVILGGNGTHKTANLLAEEGLNVIGLPKTIDNDIWGTDVTFGFHTAVDIATEVIDRIHTTAASHGRCMVIEIMGNKAGWLTLYSGIAGGADIILLPEIPYDINVVADAVRRRAENGKDFSIIAVAEGAMSVEEAAMKKKERAAFREESGFNGIANRVAKQLEEMVGVEARAVVPGHVQRGGSPSAYDRMLSTVFGVHAAQLIAAENYGQAVAMVGNAVSHNPLSEVAGKTKFVPADAQAVRAARSMGISLGD